MSENVRKICGCSRRTWAKCEHPWHFAFKWKDTHHRFSLDRHLGRHVDSKSEAIDAAAEIRKAIKAGTFGQVMPREHMTLRQLFDVYLERYVDAHRAARRQAYVYDLGTIARAVVGRPTGGSAPFGEWRVSDIITDAVLRFRETRQHTGRIGTNRLVQRLRAVYNWALATGYVDSTPFRRGGQAVVRLDREARRTRRLRDGEEASLLAASGPHLRAVIEAALETGMRRGEILSLTWSQVEGMRVKGSEIEWAPKAEIFLPAVKTKTKMDRRIPISTRLKGILEMRRIDPSGQPIALDRYVFGSEIGTRVTNFKRAWATAVLKAHGHTPSYSDTANLAPESRQAMAAIDLHFHDLRREAGSRWLEGGVPLHTVRDWLGHTSIAQTSTYLAGTTATQHDAMRQFDERRAALQQLATGSKTGGRKRARSAAPRARRARKSAVGRDQPTM